MPSTGKQVCRFWIGKKGKTENSYRPVSISDAIPYFNVWAHVHPARDWPEKDKKGAYIFVSREHESRYLNKPLKAESLRNRYVDTIKQQFPKLLDRPDIPLEDKVALRSLIYEKPHYPYLRRHEFATEIGPRVSRQVFNQLLGHSPRSNLQDVYIQASGDEGIRELEIARGIRTREETISPAQIQLQPKYCWACGETNKHNAKFCFKCNVAISKEGMLEDKEKEAEAQRQAENVKQELQVIKDKFDSIEQKYGRMMDAWEIMAQRWEKKEKEEREQKQKQPLSPSSSFVRSVEAFDRWIGDSIKEDARKVRELRKELHHNHA